MFIDIKTDANVLFDLVKQMKSTELEVVKEDCSFVES
jgi:hypothetical protein